VSSTGPDPQSSTEFSVSIGDDLIAEALAAVEKRAEESRADRVADEEDDAEPEVVFDEGDDEDDDMAVDLGDLDDLLTEAVPRPGTSEELESTRAALEAAQEALELAEQTLLEAESERDDALEARLKARRSAKKYKAALEREVEQRKRLGSTQKMLRDRLARTEARLEDAEAERKMVTESLQQVTADVERGNRDIRRLKKREDQAKATATHKAYERLCKELLPVLDNLELAIGHATTSPERVVEGVHMVAKQFVAALANVGVERVETTVGTPFDPSLHDAMQTVESAHLPPNAISAELQSGFTFDGKLLRASRVVVTRAPAVVPEPASEALARDASSDEPDFDDFDELEAADTLVPTSSVAAPQPTSIPEDGSSTDPT